MELAGRRVAVVGLGKSGVAAARFCVRRGARVVATDDRSEIGPIAAELADLGVALHLGGISAEALQGADLVVLSPGVPPTLPPLVEARGCGVPILGEIELAARFVAAPIVGVTGTNGKSTVASLCGAIAARTGRPSFCGGNLGTPLLEAVGTPAAEPDGIVVCEMSSFQLETVERLHCRAAAVLNLTADHLDRYSSLQEYGDAKARIFCNMTADDVRVLNADDPETLALYRRNHGERFSVFTFSLREAPPLGGFVDGDHLVLRLPGGQERYPTAELNLVGSHNLANALAAFLLMRASGLATPAQVREAARAFRPLPHRMEWVAERGGVHFYDDSKGTNVGAVVASLHGFPRPFALIAGGRHKGGSYAPLRQVLATASVRGVLLIGEAAPLLEEALAGANYPVWRARSMEEAVERAASLCRPGDAVVLSPACSSFDMFRDYAHRAEVYRRAVYRLGGGTDAERTP